MQRKRTAQDRLLQILHPNRQGAKKEEGHPAPTVTQGGPPPAPKAQAGSEKARCPQEEEIAEQGKKCSVKSTESPGGVSFSLLALLPVLLRRQFRAHESYNYRAAATSVQGKCK